MERISTPTAQANKFGAGKNGFNGTPPNQTELSSEWFDSIQETVAGPIEAQGIILDPGNLDQLTDAINVWSTWTAPKIPSGATLTIETGGTFLTEAGSTATFGARVTITETALTENTALQVANDSTTEPALIAVNLSTNRALLVQNGSAANCAARIENSLGGCALEGTNSGAGETLQMTNNGAGPAGAFINSDASSTVTFTNNGAGPAVTCDGDLVAPVVDTLDENGEVRPGRVAFYPDTTPGSAAGLVQWNGVRLSVGSGTTVDVIPAMRFDYKATASTAAAGTDIAGLDLSVTVLPTQELFIELDAKQFVDAVDGPLLRIRATNGVDSVAQLQLGKDDAAVSILDNATAANQKRPNSVSVLWKPIDDFPVPNNNNWTFFAQHGVPGGNNLKTTAAALKIHFR